MSSGEQAGWFLHSGGRRFGPLSEDELRTYFRAGMVKSVDRIVAPGSDEFHAAGDIARELGESAPPGPPPPAIPPPAASPPAPAASAPPMASMAAVPPVDAAEEAARQERAARAIAAMKIDLAALSAEPRSRKGSGWLVPAVLVATLVIAMLLGLNILKRLSAQSSRASAPAANGGPIEGLPPAPAPANGVRVAPAPVQAPSTFQSEEDVHAIDEMVRIGNWPALLADARKRTQEQPDRPESWQYLGAAYVRMGDFNAAADALTQALARDPSNEATRGQLADAYLQGGRHMEAIGLYKQIVASRPNDARMWNNYGTALLGAGQHVQAIAALENTVRIDPGFKAAWRSLGEAYRAIGDESRASAAFANAR